jgi:lactam utilization protein B
MQLANKRDVGLARIPRFRTDRVSAGEEVHVAAETICVHSDTSGADIVATILPHCGQDH